MATPSWRTGTTPSRSRGTTLPPERTDRCGRAPHSTRSIACSQAELPNPTTSTGRPLHGRPFRARSSAGPDPGRSPWTARPEAPAGTWHLSRQRHCAICTAGLRSWPPRRRRKARAGRPPGRSGVRARGGHDNAAGSRRPVHGPGNEASRAACRVRAGPSWTSACAGEVGRSGAARRSRRGRWPRRSRRTVRPASGRRPWPGPRPMPRRSACQCPAPSGQASGTSPRTAPAGSPSQKHDL